MHTDCPVFSAFVAFSPRRFLVPLAALLLSLSTQAPADEPPLMTHAELQAVDATGETTFVAGNSCPFRLRGIILNDSADFLSPDYVPVPEDSGAVNPGYGAQYQVFVQGLDPDRGGTALYMSEGLMRDFYTEEEWASELARVTTDPDTGHIFRPGDYVEVTANWAMGRGGKCNINEAHNRGTNMDFHIRILTKDVGLPPAEPITLADLVAEDTPPIFDPTRATGGEHWQGMRVRLDAIRLADTNAIARWNSEHPETLSFRDRLVTCADATGRTFSLRLPRRSLGPAPATNRFFSATGIINQEGSNTAGYELLVQEVGPVLDIAFEPATEDEGAPSAAVLTYSADYTGYQLEVSDDSGATWHAPDLAFPTVIIVHDSGASPTRFYRLVLPD